MESYAEIGHQWSLRLCQKSNADRSFFVLSGEAVLFQSMALFWYLLIFVGINMLYFPFFEEKGLLKRFGKEYLAYKQNVPRFIPRLRPWKNFEHIQ